MAYTKYYIQEEHSLRFVKKSNALRALKNLIVIREREYQFMMFLLFIATSLYGTNHVNEL